MGGLRSKRGVVKEEKGGGSSLGFHHSGRYVATQSRLRWVPGDPKSVGFFIFYSVGNRYKRDRNGPQMAQKAPKPHFGVILTHFGMGLVGAINTDKSSQNGPNLGPNRVFKVPFAACKCWQRAFLVTKMHFALGHTKM